jgi:hypothetical protein
LVPGFRYHVATIAAIFLALGVGIIIGSSFVQSAIVDRHTRQLAALREQFATEIGPLRAQNEQKSNAIAAMMPLLLKDRLSGARIALVQTGDYPDTVRKVREALEMAGATVSSVTVIDRSFPTRAEVNLSKLLPNLQATHPDLPGDATALVRVFAQALARGAPDSDLAVLSDAHLIDTEGDYSLPSDFVVLVGGATLENESRAESFDSVLVNQLKGFAVSVVAAEPENAAISYVPVLRGLDITTVDNADTDIGRIALALSLRGERGNYGVKQTARSGMIPPSSVPR